jgi:hypothetical protein
LIFIFIFHIYQAGYSSLALLLGLSRKVEGLSPLPLKEGKVGGIPPLPLKEGKVGGIPPLSLGEG